MIHRHFSDKNASQFTISQVDLKLILQSNDISKIQISRVINSNNEKLYERVIILDKYIGIDKFTKNSTNVITVLTDDLGNLVTATPGRIK